MKREEKDRAARCFLHFLIPVHDYSQKFLLFIGFLYLVMSRVIVLCLSCMYVSFLLPTYHLCKCTTNCFLFGTNVVFTSVIWRLPDCFFFFFFLLWTDSEQSNRTFHHPWPLQATMVFGDFLSDGKLPLVFATLITVLTTSIFSVKAPAQS